jgi:hypothetical protein
MLTESARLYRRSLWDTNPVHVEVWCESDSIASVLVDETYLFDVPLMVFRGYSSEGYLYTLGEEIKAQVRGLNGAGAAVGQSMQSSPFCCDATVRAVHWDVATLVVTDLSTVLTTPGWELHLAVGVNDGGAIAAVGTFGGTSQGALLTPVPPPSPPPPALRPSPGKERLGIPPPPRDKSRYGTPLPQRKP